MAKSVLAIAAHPDDIEFFMSGTLMKLGEAGYATHYMNLANGCCGTTQYDVETIVAMRRTEAMAAAHSIGATYHESICNDLEVFYNRELLGLVAATVRQVEPQIVLTHSPADYMEDHMNACRLAVTAAFARGMPNFPVQPHCEPTSQPVTVYHAQPFSHRDPLGNPVIPDFFIDVGDVVERKTAMLAEHVSQKRWLDESQGHDSYLQTLRDLDAECGRMSTTFDYAEGWRRRLHLGYCGPDDNPLADALSGCVHFA
ncbi:MAG: PIG-L family deacetylase [Pirellulaceae bacterium]|jgi:LmbE family N-acetylglucosaminyl deacetylase|nr:PIG-L family deacetylase [Pirellulaceae bacterium]MDP7020431.1 PIG-L family deacetylase [Pirellulaceae bacterium]